MLHQDLLPNEEILLLSQLLDTRLYEIMSPTLTVVDNSSQTPLAVIRFYDRWLSLSAHYMDFANGMSYSKIKVATHDIPPQLPHTSYGSQYPGRIRIDKGKKPKLINLSMQTTIEEHKDKKIVYDSGIILFFESSPCFCISSVDDASELIELSAAPLFVQTVTDNTTSRMIRNYDAYSV